MRNPLISVIFTSYNHKSYLKKSLLSVLNQDYSNLEIIVIDDNSNDGSQDILKKIKKEYPQIKLILRAQNSGGYVNSLTSGIKYTNGKFLSFIQCDDFISKSFYSKMIKKINDFKNIGAVFCRSNIINSKGKKIGDDFLIREKSFRNYINSDYKLISGSQMLYFLNYSCIVPNLSGVLFLKKAYLDLNGLDNSFSVVSDWDFYIRMSSNFNFLYVNKRLNNFRSHVNTIRSKTSGLKILNEIGIMFNNNSSYYNVKSISFKIRIGSIIFNYLKNDRNISLVSIKTISPSFQSFFLFPHFYVLLGSIKFIYEYFNKKK